MHMTPTRVGASVYVPSICLNPDPPTPMVYFPVIMTIRTSIPLFVRQVVVHQRCREEAMEGATEVLSFHHVQTQVDHEGVGSMDKLSAVQDSYTIFGTQALGGSQARAMVKESTRFSKPQARAVAYEDARPSKRRKKDPNRPRGYISAFNFFVQDKRRTYVQNRPNAKVTLYDNRGIFYFWIMLSLKRAATRTFNAFTYVLYYCMVFSSDMTSCCKLNVQQQRNRQSSTRSS